MSRSRWPWQASEGTVTATDTRFAAICQSTVGTITYDIDAPAEARHRLRDPRAPASSAKRRERSMVLQTFCIYIETPVGTPLGDSINGIRPWLYRHDIDPVEFKSETKGGVITLDLRFRSQDEALLFERDFALDEVDAFR
jgi:hypothetical protein